jgi:hypothetical protein
MKFDRILMKHTVHLLKQIQREDGTCIHVPEEAVYFVSKEAAEDFCERYNAKPGQEYYAQYEGQELL